NGIALYTLPLHLLKMSFATASISEWHSVDFAHFDPLLLWIGLAILGGFSLGLKLPWSRTMMVLLLLWLALTHVRNKELLGIIAPLLIAVPLAKQLGQAAPPQEGAPARGWRSAAVALVIALGFFATAAALDRRGVAPRGDVAPIAAVE